MLMSAAFLASALIQFALGLAVAWILGPAEFGRYALALAAAVLAQTALFEWLRLAAIRFHHAGDPEPGRRIRRLFARIAAVTLLAAPVLALLPVTWKTLAALGPLLAVSSAYAELRAALLRAEFDTSGYARIVLVRNGAAFVAMPLAAGLGGSAEWGLVGFLAAVLVAIVDDALAARRRPARATPREGSDITPDWRVMLGYSGPIILTNVLYLGLFFALRGAVAAFGGIVAAGQFSLAFDFVAKLVTTIGTALDLILFQQAVRATREEGEAAGEARLRHNALIVLAIIAAAALGLALVVPSIEALLVAPEFRGAFRLYTLAILPGLALYALVQYALHPVFQLRTETPRLPKAAGIALAIAAGPFMASLFLGGGMALAAGTALGAGMLAASLHLAARAGGNIRPAMADLLRLAVCLGVLWIVTLPARALPPGALALVAISASGAAGFALAAYALDLGGLRGLVAARRGRA